MTSDYLAFASTFRVSAPYAAGGVNRAGLGKRAEMLVDLVEVARQHPGGVTLGQAAEALLGADTEQGRRVAKLRLLRHVEAGRLRRIRGNVGGVKPDRFVAV